MDSKERRHAENVVIKDTLTLTVVLFVFMAAAYVLFWNPSLLVSA